MTSIHAEKTRPYCLRCEVPIYEDEFGTWRREATGTARCTRNPADDGHEPILSSGSTELPPIQRFEDGSWSVILPAGWRAATVESADVESFVSTSW